MHDVPYGSPPPPRPHDPADMQQIMLAQRREMQEAKGDITELKDLARRLNTKYETEQKRLRQLQEDIVNANVQSRNVMLQNEDLRQKVQHIEAHGVEQRHVHTVRVRPGPDGTIVAIFGLLIIAGMFAAILYAVAVTAG